MDSGYDSWVDLAQALEKEWLPEFIKGLTLSRTVQRAGEVTKKKERQVVTDLGKVVRRIDEEVGKMRRHLEHLEARMKDEEESFHAVEKLCNTDQLEITRLRLEISESKKRTNELDADIHTLRAENTEAQERETRLVTKLQRESALLAKEKKEFKRISALAEGLEMAQEDLSCRLNYEISKAKREVTVLDQRVVQIKALRINEFERIPVLQARVTEGEESLHRSILEKSDLNKVLSGLQNQHLSLTSEISTINRQAENTARKNLDVLLASDTAAEAVKEKEKELDLLDRSVQLQMTSVIEVEYTRQCFEKMRIKAMDQVAQLMFKMRMFWAFQKGVQVKKVANAYKAKVLEEEKRWAKLVMEEIDAEEKKVAEEQKKAKAKPKKSKTKKPGKKDGARKKPAEKSGIAERLIENITEDLEIDLEAPSINNMRPEFGPPKIGKLGSKPA